MKEAANRGGLHGQKAPAFFSLLRVAGCGRDAIDGLPENTLDVVYRSHGSHDGAYRIHPGAAANGIQIVDAQFANFVVHVSPLFCLGGAIPSCTVGRSDMRSRSGPLIGCVIGVTNPD
jgi:hypothetical protein